MREKNFSNRPSQKQRYTKTRVHHHDSLCVIEKSL